MAARPQLEGMLLDGRYRIDTHVASGGFGDVFRGHHMTLGIDVAIKTARRQEDNVPVMAVLDEARATARLRHTHIAATLDAGLHIDGEHPNGLPWLVLEWVDGPTLKQYLASRDGPLDAGECLDLIVPIADAIAHAHQMGIVHRDIKPSNVMLQAKDGGHSPLVVDFGVAKAISPETAPGAGDTTTESVRGAFSRRYAAPEQLARKRTGPWTDVHALGLLMTEMLVKRLPYAEADGSSDALHEKCFSPTRPTPASFDIDVPELEPIISKALALRPADRFSDGVALRDALQTVRSRPTPQSRTTQGRTTQGRTTRQWWLAAPLIAAVGWLAWAWATRDGAQAPPKALAFVTTVPAVVVPASMRLIRGGTFWMGSSQEQVAAAQASCAAAQVAPEVAQVNRACATFARESPPRRTSVASFLIDSYEIRVDSFVAWLQQLEGKRVVVADEGQKIIHNNRVVAGVGGYGAQIVMQGGRAVALPGQLRRAVVLVSWHGADGYCNAQHKRLPTEAEWAFAARGTDAREYAWGSKPPACDSLVYGRLPSLPCARHPSGPIDVATIVGDVTPQGVVGMGGNVREWVADRFTSANTRVIRGCGWWELPFMCRAARRGFDNPEWVDAAVGFRCAKDA